MDKMLLTLRCPICRASNLSNMLLKRHMTTLHSPIFAEICDRQIVAAIPQSFDDSVIKTDDTSDISPSTTSTNDGVEIASKRNPWIYCRYCRKNVYNPNNSILHHYRLAHQFRCSRCDRVWTSLEAMLRHFYSLHGGLKERCTVCNKYVYIGECYTRHMQEKHLKKQCRVRLERVNVDRGNGSSMQQGSFTMNQRMYSTALLSEDNNSRRISNHMTSRKEVLIGESNSSVASDGVLIKEEYCDKDRQGTLVALLSLNIDQNNGILLDDKLCDKNKQNTVVYMTSSDQNNGVLMKEGLSNENRKDSLVSELSTSIQYYNGVPPFKAELCDKDRKDTIDMLLTPRADQNNGVLMKTEPYNKDKPHTTVTMLNRQAEQKNRIVMRQERCNENRQDHEVTPLSPDGNLKNPVLQLKQAVLQLNRMEQLLKDVTQQVSSDESKTEEVNYNSREPTSRKILFKKSVAVESIEENDVINSKITTIIDPSIIFKKEPVIKLKKCNDHSYVFDSSTSNVPVINDQPVVDIVNESGDSGYGDVARRRVDESGDTVNSVVNGAINDLKNSTGSPPLKRLKITLKKLPVPFSSSGHLYK